MMKVNIYVSENHPDYKYLVNGDLILEVPFIENANDMVDIGYRLQLVYRQVVYDRLSNDNLLNMHNCSLFINQENVEEDNEISYNLVYE